ncbi:MAG: PAS domain-containing protein, partial [Rhodobacterales bacterium]|nr:PAS domain-containing protein [Rhodobacterales bacterium]
MNQTDTQRAALPGRPLSWALAAAVAGGGGVALAWGGMPLVAGLLGGASVAAAVGFGFVLGRERGRDPVAHMLRAAVDGHHEGRAVSDGAGNIVYANAAFRRLFPLPTGRPWRMDSAADLVRADDDPQRAYRRLLASAASAVPDEADLPLDLPTGNKPWRRVTVAPLPGAGDGPLADHALWQVADVTRRRQKDQRRHREDRMVADFLDHMPSGFFSADADGNLIYANQTLADWLGVDRADLAGRQARFADFVVAEESLPAARRDEDGEATQHGEVTL